jgi:L-lactate dehydrogenase
VFRLKGYTDHAIATATCMVIEAIVFDQNRTMPLSTRFQDWMNIADNCFSIPVVVGRNGIIRHLHPEMDDYEQACLQNAATAIKSAIVSLVPDLVG